MQQNGKVMLLLMNKSITPTGYHMKGGTATEGPQFPVVRWNFYELFAGIFITITSCFIEQNYSYS